jgi:hypothetical protein
MRHRNGVVVARVALVLLCLRPVAAAEAQLTLELRDYVTMPITGAIDGAGSNGALLSRVNALREEPGGAARLFVIDLNGPMYILDKKTKKLSVYLDFNGRDERPGMFHRLLIETGLGNGLNGLYFDPDYRRNGRFYTVHMEDPNTSASNVPDNRHVPGLSLSGYTTTGSIMTPGPVATEGVLIEWTDTNISNATFEGTARELLRVPLNTRIHPMGDLIFNPAARRGDPEWRVLYLECGDGGSGESRDLAIRSNPQRLDNLEGKILRIIPDLNERASTSRVSENGRYRIPDDNPFVATSGARKEIWAYGFRNPHRLSWAIDPENPANNRLIANSVGLHTWETVNIVRKGANYGYSQREGNEVLTLDNTTAPRPSVDRIPMQVGEQVTGTSISPTYAVIRYGHVPGGGDAIGSGFVYNGRALQALRGKYVFSDITTGRVWWADYKDMLAADDGDPATLAPMHEVMIAWDNPNDSPDTGRQVYDSMVPINEATYHFRGGMLPHLSNAQTVATQGRADARLAVDEAGEFYIYTKSDGMIRQVSGAILK